MHKNVELGIAAMTLAVALAPIAASAQGRRAAATAKPETSTSADEEAIRAQAREFEAGFAKGDAAAIAATWTSQAEFYEDGGVELRGRDAIEQAYSELFAAHPGASIKIQIKSIRFPSANLAVEEGVSILSYAGPELPSSARYQATHVREGGQWLTAISREWGAAEDKLHDIAWLVGDWSASTPEGETKLSYQWNKSNTALNGTFATVVAGKTESSGHQQITLNPQTGQIHSRMFDDEGGHGEAVWSRDGNRWLLDSSGVSPNGTATAATNVLTRLNENEFMWRSVNRATSESGLAPTDPVKLTRVKSAD